MNKYTSIGLLTLLSCNIQITSSKYFSALEKIEAPEIVGPKDLKEELGINIIYYSNSIVESNGKKIPITVWNFREKIEKKEIKNLDNFIDKLEDHIATSKKAINADYYNTDVGTVIEYLNYHLENLPKTTLLELGIDEHQTTKEKTNILYKHLNLKKVAFYPIEPLGDFAIFDYTIPSVKTDLLLVVKMTINGEITELVMES